MLRTDTKPGLPTQVRCRLRIPTPHGKDRKSAAVDVWVVPQQQQQQQLQLICRIGDSVVEAKVRHRKRLGGKWGTTGGVSLGHASMGIEDMVARGAHALRFA